MGHDMETLYINSTVPRDYRIVQSSASVKIVNIFISLITICCLCVSVWFLCVMGFIVLPFEREKAAGRRLRTPPEGQLAQVGHNSKRRVRLAPACPKPKTRLAHWFLGIARFSPLNRQNPTFCGQLPDAFPTCRHFQDNYSTGYDAEVQNPDAFGRFADMIRQDRAVYGHSDATGQIYHQRPKPVVLCLPGGGLVWRMRGKTKYGTL